MSNIKTLTLAAMTALSLGIGTAMAGETAGGVGFGPWETQQLRNALSVNHQAAAESAQPQAGSSDVERAPAFPQQILLGGDGGAS